MIGRELRRGAYTQPWVAGGTRHRVGGVDEVLDIAAEGPRAPARFQEDGLGRVGGDRGRRGKMRRRTIERVAEVRKRRLLSALLGIV